MKKGRESRPISLNWSKRRESDPRIYLGKVMFYH